MASISGKSGLSIKARLDKEEEKFKLERQNRESFSEEIYDLNDLIGPFGIYQVLVMIFACLREAITSFDSVGPSLALPLDDTFQCVINETLNQRHLENPEGHYDPKCYYIDTTNETILPCTEWIFQEKYQSTMLAEWKLVCDREYLASMVHSSFFTGLLLGIVLWGPLADKIGRWKSYSLCHTAYLIFGTAAVFAPNVYWFMVFRFLAGFHAIGYYILYTLQVEMIATQYRPFSNTLNHAGWGLGVLLVPFIGHYINEWRYLIAVAPIANAILMPYMFILPESIRWMVLDGQTDKARKEIKRGAKLNRLRITGIDKKIDKFFALKKLDQLDSSESQGSFVKLFTNSVLFKGLTVLSFVYGVLMYIYYSRTLHYAPDEASMFANFIITGSGEWLSLLISATSMYHMPRKTCLAIFLGITSVSIFVEGIAHSTMDYVWPILDYTTDAFIKVFAMCAVMVTFLVMLETFPTELRQSGITVILIFGGACIVVAPFHIEFEELLGHMPHTFLIAIITIMLAIAIKYSLRETGKSDILDSVATDQSDDRPQTRQSRQNQQTTFNNTNTNSAH